MVFNPEKFVELIKSIKGSNLFNPYTQLCPHNDQEGANNIRETNLLEYLKVVFAADSILIGEAPGYLGCRRTGLPFTDNRQGDREFTSMHWHHFECGLEKYSEEMVDAELEMELPDDLAAKLKSIKKSKSASAFDLKGINMFNLEGRKANIKTEVARAMSVKETEHFEGGKRICKSVFIIEGEQRSKLFLWDEHASLPLQKGDLIVAVGVITQKASNDKIQFHTLESSKILINPDDAEIEKNTKSIDIYEAKTWSRPGGKPVQMEHAKSSRAACKICNETISKGTLKIVKPVWAKNDVNNQFYPGTESFHLMCVIKDMNGEDIIHEAITRLTPELVKEENKVLQDLLNVLPEITARKILHTILN